LPFAFVRIALQTVCSVPVSFPQHVVRSAHVDVVPDAHGGILHSPEHVTSFWLHVVQAESIFPRQPLLHSVSPQVHACWQEMYVPHAPENFPVL
jgi:hypothetical protein